MRDKILQIICQHYGVQEYDVLDRKHVQGRASEARQMLFYQSVKYISPSHKYIGSIFGNRTRQTVEASLRVSNGLEDIGDKCFLANKKAVESLIESALGI